MKMAPKLIPGMFLALWEIIHIPTQLRDDRSLSDTASASDSAGHMRQRKFQAA